MEVESSYSSSDKEEEEEKDPLVNWYTSSDEDEDEKDPLMIEKKNVMAEKFTRDTFAEEAINKLDMRINQDDEKSKEVYLCVGEILEKERARIKLRLTWLIVNPNINEMEKTLSFTRADCNTTHRRTGFPSELKDITDYGCAVWNSTIIIAGGNCNDVPSNNFFLYDTLSKTWAPTSKMNTKRGSKPTIVVLHNRIYVFGGYLDFRKDDNDDDVDDNDTDTPMVDGAPLNTRISKYWAEFCDLNDTATSHPCKFSPLLHRFPDGLLKTCPIDAHVVCPRLHRILFWTDYDGTFYFDYKNNLWGKYDKYAHISQGPQWSKTVVLLQDFLFWHHHGTIYAHNLQEDLTIPAYTFSCSDIFGPIHGDYAPIPTYLVHIGKDRLCLFCWVNKHSMWYGTLVVHINRSIRPPTLQILLVHSGVKKSPPILYIDHALEISSS